MTGRILPAPGRPRHRYSTIRRQMPADPAGNALASPEPARHSLAGARVGGRAERADIERRIQPPLHVGEKAADVPCMADQQRARARGRADRLDLRIDRPCADSGLRGHALQPADLARPRRQLHGRGSPASARAGVPQRTWRGAAEGLRRAVRRPQPAPGHDRVDGLWRSQREGLRRCGWCSTASPRPRRRSASSTRRC